MIAPAQESGVTADREAIRALLMVEDIMNVLGNARVTDARRIGNGTSLSGFAVVAARCRCPVWTSQGSSGQPVE
jgi:hypothetical protein